MAVLLAPGVYIFEKESQAQIVEAVSTSTGAVLGFTHKGPENEATLVTNWSQYVRRFGLYTANNDSISTLLVSQFFLNGGSNLMVVRITPADAVAATSVAHSSHIDDATGEGDGTTATAVTAIATGFAVNDGDSPIVPSSVAMRWRTDGSALTDEVAQDMTGAADLDTVAGTLKYAGKIPIIPDVDENLLAINPAGITATYTALDAGTPTFTFTVASGASIATATDGDSTAILDLKTGIFSILFGSAQSEAPSTLASSVLFTYTQLRGDTGTGATVNVGVVADGLDITFDATNLGTNGGTGANSGANGNGWVIIIDATLTGDHAISPSLSGAREITVILEEAGAAIVSDSADVKTAIEGLLIPDLQDANIALEGAGSTDWTDSETLFFAGGYDATDHYAVVDDGVGAWADSLGRALAAAGALDYDDGSYDFTTNDGAAPPVPSSEVSDGTNMISSYDIEAWALTASSKGAWGNDLRVTLEGEDDSFDIETGAYSTFTAFVEEYSSDLLEYAIRETFTELSFDSTNSKFFPSIMNDLSDLITVDLAGGDEPPLTLQGDQFSVVVSGGDESLSNQTVAVAGLQGLPISPRSVSITYTADDGTTKTITDNGQGALIGDVDPTGTNTIVYTTGVAAFTTLDLVKAGTLMTLAYAKEAVEDTNSSVFGVTASGFTAGANGTFDGTNYGRTQFTDIALQATFAGVYALDRVLGMLTVFCPDFAGDETISRELLTYADNRRTQLPSGGDRFVVLSVPEGLNAQEAVDWNRYTLNYKSKYGSLYAGWVRVPDPFDATRIILTPPVGIAAGIFARSDNLANVSTAPAGSNRAQIQGVSGVETVWTIGEIGVLNAARVNAIISSVHTGVALWGARTLSLGTAWLYIQATRLFMFVEQSVYQSTHWAVFENNGPALWDRLRLQLNDFLAGLFNQGYFAGDSPAQSFFVKVDAENNPPEVVNAGRVVIEIGLAPTKPAEFVTFTFEQIQLS